LLRSIWATLAKDTIEPVFPHKGSSVWVGLMILLKMGFASLYPSYNG
jgi:hypothetical protein